MAAVANTVLTTAATGNREELDDFVSMITPTDTPIYTMAGKAKADSKHPEWEYEDLETTGDNAQPEGNEFSFDAVSAPTRVGNYTQIFTKTFTFSGTQEAVDNAGNAEKRAHELMKKGKALRKDIEFSIVANTASTNTDPRRSGGLPTWLDTNTSRGSGGSDGGFSGGVTTVATNGTQRAWTKALTDTLLQSIYQNGGDVTTVVCSPYNKGVFATFMSDSNVAPFRYAAGKGTNTIIGTADIYEGPLGTVKVMPNRVMSVAANSRNVFALDPSLVKWLSLRPIQEVKGLAKTGDRESGVLLAEGTLKIVNEKGLGVIGDVYGLTASS
jgi:hypothetical protein